MVHIEDWLAVECTKVLREPVISLSIPGSGNLDYCFFKLIQKSCVMFNNEEHM